MASPKQKQQPLKGKKASQQPKRHTQSLAAATAPNATTTMIRTILLASCMGYFAQRYFQSRLLPHGAAVHVPERPSFAPVDPTNDLLQGKHGKLTKIYERLDDDTPEEGLLKGPETVVINPKEDGSIYVLTEEAKLVRLTEFQQHSSKTTEGTASASIVTAKATTVVDLGMGRPLGGRFTADGKTIYIADALLGLIRVVNPHNFPKSKVELVAHQVHDPQTGNMSKILYANDVAIGPKTGKVYFTDATDITSDRIETRTWDTMYAAKTDLMRGKRAGRLLEYDPQTNQLAILAQGFWFANGVGVDSKEDFIFLSETFALRMLKVYLKGDKRGTVEVLADSPQMTGYPDGADCDPKGTKCYAVMPSAIVPLAKLINKVPSPFDRILRNLVMMLPKKWAPKIKPYGGVMEVDPHNTKEIQYFQDPKATDIGHLAGVTVWDNKLYLGSLRNNFVGVYDLK